MAIELGYFVDLVVFTVALDKLFTLQGDTSHTQKGIQLLRRYQPSLVEGVQTFLVPLADQPSLTRFRAPLEIATRSTIGIVQAQKQSNTLSDVIVTLRKNADLFRDTFTGGRALPAAMKLATVLAVEDAEAVLNGLATVPPASKLQLTRAWVKEAAEQIGFAPSTTESVLVDAESARQLASDLKTVEAKLTFVPPDSQEAADLQEQKQELLDNLDQVAENSSNPTVVLAAAASVAANETGYATKTGRKLRLSPAQEQAMMLRGKGVIAAGAGSGKTKTLAGKVVYHMDELGVSPNSIIATSFSRKSAAELRGRIEEYGGVFGRGEDTGLGTTHSIAAKLIREYGGLNRDALKPYEQTNAIRLAMRQVEMQSTQYIAPPRPESLLPKFGVSTTPVLQPVSSGLTFKQALERAFQNRTSLRNPFHRAFIEAFFNSQDKFYRINLNMTRNHMDISGLSDKQLKILQSVFDATGVQYSKATDPNFSKKKTAAKKRDMDKGLREKYPTFQNSLNQWFNLGLVLTTNGDPEGEPLRPEHFKQAITKFKGQMISPSEAYDKAYAGGKPAGYGIAEAAVYGAYEYIKGPRGEQELALKGDFDDILIEVSRMLLSNPVTLSRAQSRFKVILVDEAQDLNKCVHGDTLVETPKGPVKVQDVSVGDRVLSYENGQIVFNNVLNKVRSSWERGYRVRTSSGRELLMSPDHRIYATPLYRCAGGQMALYLMYRTGMGFRIGTTTRLFECHHTSSGRAGQENADCAWILEVGEPKDILYKEQSLSLRYGVPTYVFNGTARQCDQDRIDRIFEEFGQNGRELLKAYDLDEQYPHWVSGAVSRGKTNRKVVNFCPHRGKGHKNVQRGSTINMNWTTSTVSQKDIPLPVYTTKRGGKMVNKLVADYAEGRSLAEYLAKVMGAFLVESLWIGKEKLRLITASGVRPGMKVLVWGGGFDVRPQDTLSIKEYKDIAAQLGVSIECVGGARNTGKLAIHEYLREVQVQRGLEETLPSIEGAESYLDEVVAVERVESGDFWDISVESSHNFFGNGILTHNCQHVLFGLLAGFIDPEKADKVAYVDKIAQLAKDDGSMTADTYCFIGDDAQAIYEFRGADPNAFIDMSDLVEGGAGFKTQLLTTNYRSGQNIVEAANRLIAYNTKQIPKACLSNPNRLDKGGITNVVFPAQEGKTSSAPAEWLAERVQEMMDLGEGGKKGYNAFGVGLRSNAEAYVYGLELLKRGIPFRSNANFFRDPNTKALLHWLTLADEGLDGDVSRINEAVLNARSAPVSMLGQRFVDVMTERATGNYLTWLQNEWAQIYGATSSHADNVKAYLDNLLFVVGLKDAGLSNEVLLDTLLNLQGFDGSTMEEALIDKVRDNEELMAEIRSASTLGEVDEEAVREQAMAPIAPLVGLLSARADLREAMGFVRTLQRANDTLTTKDDPDAKGFKEPAVTLGTMHSWKGLEVENMFVPFVGGRFPRVGATDEDLASERRLAYVALTRGENNVFVMDIPTIRQTKQGPIIERSQFVGEMCLPTVKTASVGFITLPGGVSAHDPEVMDRMLQNEGLLWDDLLYTED